MCGRLYKPAKATGKILITGKEAYESFKPTWFSANDILTSHLTVHQYLVYKGMLLSGSRHSVCTERATAMHLPRHYIAAVKLVVYADSSTTFKGISCMSVCWPHMTLLQVVFAVELFV